MTRLAVIGCGDASTGYSDVRLRLQRAAFAAAADADLDRARLTAQALDAPIWAGSLDDLLARDSEAFDAVLIDSRDMLHAALVEKAAGAGKHVFVEMPLALSTEAADAAIAACQSAGVRLMAGQAMRFMESHLKVKEGLASGNLGVPGALRIHHWEPAVRGAARLPEPGAGLCGGTAMLRAVREIDLANWLFGGLPTEVYAIGRGQSEGGSKEPDYVQVHLGFPEGGMALIDHSMTLQGGTAYFSLTMVGSTGAAYADDHHNMQLLYGGGVPSALDTGEGKRHIAAHLQEFVDAIAEEREPAITGADGRAAVQVAEAAVGSMASGCAARLIGGRYEPV